jgi:hypothetical protein
MRRLRDAALLVFVAANGYHALNCAARFMGVQALRDLMRFDPEVLDAYMDRIEAEMDH